MASAEPSASLAFPAPAPVAGRYQGLSRADVAFIKALLEKLPLRTAADLYMAEGTDLREAKGHAEFLMDLISSWASRQQGVARQQFKILGDLASLSIDDNLSPDGKAPEQRANAAGPDVSFEEFCAKHPDASFWTERELLELYQEQVERPWQLERARTATDAKPLSPAASTRKALHIHKEMLRALDQAESQLVIDATPEHELRVWFRHRPAVRRLEDAGIRTIGDFHRLVSAKGYLWHESIVGIGMKRAALLLRRLQDIAPRMELHIPTTALAPRHTMTPEARISGRARETGVVPLESLDIPASLDGSRGVNRGPPGNFIGVENDFAAVQAWLERYKNSENTFRSFRKEVERLMLWCICERKIALSDMRAPDCEAYAAFLRDPQPRARWISKNRHERFSTEWRPFKGPLSPNGVVRALDVCSSLFTWLSAALYTAGNPLIFRGKQNAKGKTAKQALKRAAQASERKERIIDLPLWSMIDKTLTTLDVKVPANVRTIAVFRLAQQTGLRAEEMMLAQVSDITLSRYSDGTPYHRLFVRGKGDRTRDVPLSQAALAAIEAHLAMRGLPPRYEECPINAYLVGRIDIKATSSPSLRDEGVSYGTLYTIIKSFFKRLQDSEEAKSALSDTEREKLGRASTHWLRHCFASLSLQSGMPIGIVRGMLGHENESTTRIYATEEIEEMARAREAADRTTQSRLMKIRGEVE